MSVRLEPKAISHAVHFYGSDDELIATMLPYLAESLDAGHAAVVIATPQHAAAFRSGLSTKSELPAARLEDRLVILDAEQTLAGFMVLGKPDSQAFDATVGHLVRQVRSKGQRAVAFGEMVALLWERGNVAGAIELEMLWNQLLAEEDFSLYCAYPHRIIQDPQADELHAMCALHSDVLGPPQTRPQAAPRSEEIRLECSNESPREARLLVADALARWGHAQLIDDVQMTATELVTNSVLHARTDLLVRLSVTRDRVRLSVADGSVISPSHLIPSDELESSGRGMMLVAALADDWGVHLDEGGKEVWAEFLLERRA